MSEELFDKEAEQNIIGAILISPESMHELDKLGAEDFSEPSWRALFSCCVNLWQRGEPINNVSLFKEFERSAGENADASAAAELIARAGSQTVTASNVSMLAHAVRSLGVRRRALSSVRDILTSLGDTSVSLEEVLDNARMSLDKLSYLPSASRVVLFRDGIEIGGGSPIYEFNVIRPSDLLSTRIRLTSVEIDKPGEVRRKIRENLHFNPRLPTESWQDFVHAIVSLSTKTQTPEALEQDSEIIFWMREWFKTATPAEEPDDLINGYVEKGDMYYIQPMRLLKWLNEHAKVKPNITMLWSVIQGRGARRDISIRLKQGGTRKLWGVPASFLNPTDDETQLSLTDENDESGEEIIDLGEFED